MTGLDQSITTSLTRSVMAVGPTPPEFEHLLTDDALEFVASLARRFRPAIAAMRPEWPSAAPTVPAPFDNTARPLYLLEAQVEVDGLPISAGIFDFGLFVFHNAGQMTPNGARPYFHLPKFDGPNDAQLWADVFSAVHEMLGIRRGAIRAKVQRA